ncbi:hypothetical protein GLOIN_2v1646400 [Rhizophagus irregularis DAOM 181602=DAOM 197198]|uniref:Uncharacterized protein n=1 Tax=Rhizophagus irregularis (strain DAOM 181602 / DAOM 197198 / MUCL 43194) TaxID=747089 RepID=A0A2P4PPY6_RHIID|nr:hypothetical protein GLOIN_2v1646400 [Rhizophagus irregularis DAOM 181602=DAOM 197198]POG67469.1 hypothetical protein GLOIN_2v1646400 [Rhizophagus irregularis DAOM 181602=DAOM 197198]|eukprot:XP_025174335.1 hypothetical protein GLOIN_2v1646400 [Rhizophagus irregularis DAOM 181602=DAOM 197198]
MIVVICIIIRCGRLLNWLRLMCVWNFGSITTTILHNNTQRQKLSRSQRIRSNKWRKCIMRL